MTARRSGDRNGISNTTSDISHSASKGVLSRFLKNHLALLSVIELIYLTSRPDDLLYVAMYPYESNELGDLSFVAGEVVTVIKKDGDWWTGVIGARSGVFPSNYVQKASDFQQCEVAADSEVEAATAAAAASATTHESPAQTGQPLEKRPSTAPVDGDYEVCVEKLSRQI